jgi:hypothetical protein
MVVWGYSSTQCVRMLQKSLGLKDTGVVERARGEFTVEEAPPAPPATRAVWGVDDSTPDVDTRVVITASLLLMLLLLLLLLLPNQNSLGVERASKAARLVCMKARGAGG